VTAPEPRAAEPEASDLGRFEPTAYDLGITDDPDVGWSDLELEAEADYDAEAAEYDVEPEAGL
jgi:hypothetical protein